MRMSQQEFQEKIPDRGYCLYEELHQLNHSLQAHQSASTLADSELTQLGLSRDWSMSQHFEIPHNNNHVAHPPHPQGHAHPQAHQHHNNNNHNSDYYLTSPLTEAPPQVHPHGFADLNCYSGQPAPGPVGASASLHPPSGHDRILYDSSVSYQQEPSMDFGEHLHSVPTSAHRWRCLILF